jgi:serine/threonine-protein kinase
MVPADASVITQHVNDALRSPLFSKAERQARFLRFVVDAALRAPGSAVRETDIAMAVYDRRGDYDPRIDPIVRVEAARLRARLREYYEHSPPTHVRIDLPKGRYVPQFTVVGPPVDRVPAPHLTSILVRPARTLSPDTVDQHFCDGLAEEITYRLARLGTLRVVPPSAERFAELLASPSGFLLDASVRGNGAEILLTVHLVRLSDGAAQSSQRYDARARELFAAQERLADAVCRDIAEACRQLAGREAETGS